MRNLLEIGFRSSAPQPRPSMAIGRHEASQRRPIQRLLARRASQSYLNVQARQITEVFDDTASRFVRCHCAPPSMDWTDAASLLACRLEQLSQQCRPSTLSLQEGPPRRTAWVQTSSQATAAIDCKALTP